MLEGQAPGLLAPPPQRERATEKITVVVPKSFYSRVLEVKEREERRLNTQVSLTAVVVALMDRGMETIGAVGEAAAAAPTGAQG